MIIDLIIRCCSSSFTIVNLTRINRQIVDHTIRKKSRIEKAGAEELNPHASGLPPLLLNTRRYPGNVCCT